MADYRTSPSVLDAALQHIIDSTDRQVAVSADPVNFGGVAAVTLAEVAMTSGDFSLSNGDVSGRKLAMGIKNTITPSATGTATHLLLVDDTASEILLMVPVPDTSLSTAVDVDFAPWEHEIRENEGA